MRYLLLIASLLLSCNDSWQLKVYEKPEYDDMTEVVSSIGNKASTPIYIKLLKSKKIIQLSSLPNGVLEVEKKKYDFLVRGVTYYNGYTSVAYSAKAKSLFLYNFLELGGW